MVADEDTILLYRPTGPAEFELLKENDYSRWPPRLPDQPIFYPVVYQAYAEEIAKQWNVPSKGVAYITRFRVKKNFWIIMSSTRWAVSFISNIGFQLKTSSS